MGIHITPIFNINFSHLEVGNLEVSEDASITGDLDGNTATFNSLSVVNGGDITVDDIYIQNTVHGGNADFNEISGTVTGKIKATGTTTVNPLPLGTLSYDIIPNDDTVHSMTSQYGNNVVLDNAYYTAINKVLTPASNLPTIIIPPNADDITLSTVPGVISFTLTTEHSRDDLKFYVYNTYTGSDVLLGSYNYFTNITKTISIPNINALKLKFVFANTLGSGVACSVKLNNGTGTPVSVYT